MVDEARIVPGEASAEMIDLVRSAYEQGYDDGVEDQSEDRAHKDCRKEGFHNWLDDHPLAATPPAPPADLEAESRELLAAISSHNFAHRIRRGDPLDDILGLEHINSRDVYGAIQRALSARQIAQGVGFGWSDDRHIDAAVEMCRDPRQDASPPPSEEAAAAAEELRAIAANLQVGRREADTHDRLLKIATLITRLSGGEVERLREALERIAVGDEPRPIGKQWRNDGKPSKNDKCTHDVWMYETCGNCVSECARAALTPKEPQP